MNFYKIIIISFVTLGLSGCSLFDKKPVITNDPNESVISPAALGIPVAKMDDTIKHFTENNTNIGTLSKGISTIAEKTAIANPKLKELPEIKKSADKIDSINQENVKNTQQLVEVKDQLVKASGEVEGLKKEVEKQKTELQKGMNKILLMVYGLCILGMAAGVILIFFEQRGNGIIALGSSMSILGLVYFLQEYAWVLGLMSGLFVVGLLIVCALQILGDSKVKAELVKSFEVVKNATKYSSDEKLAVTNIQSEKTITEVENIKKKLGV